MSTESQKRKKENNLGFSQETKFLVTEYRMLKVLEHIARRLDENADDFVEEKYGRSPKKLRETFVNFAVWAHDKGIPDLKFYKSNELIILGSLYRALQKRELLYYAIAKVAYKRMNDFSKIDRKLVNSYAAHLRYYRNHPEIHREYKLK